MKKKKSSLELPEELDHDAIASLITKSMEITRELLRKFDGIPSIKFSIFAVIEQQAIFRAMNSDVNNTVCKPDILAHMELWISQLEDVKRCGSLSKACLKRISILLQFYKELCLRLKHEQSKNRNQSLSLRHEGHADRGIREQLNTTDEVARQLVFMKTKGQLNQRGAKPKHDGMQIEDVKPSHDNRRDTSLQHDGTQSENVTSGHDNAGNLVNETAQAALEEEVALHLLQMGSNIRK